ncbi:hypothetical protein [Roseovarius albus]|uniref:hypothetical protein n=1 Tax=Roseovarius albus TaxID=1247867 RepID=UPI000A26763F|nr:hypothetical protein [Roseovarius albus]
MNNKNPETEPGLFTARKIADCLEVPIEFLAGISSDLEAEQNQLKSPERQHFFNGSGTATRGTRNSARAERRKNTKIDDLIRWWHSTGGRLENYEDISDNIDLHHQPRTTDTTIQVGSIGKNSLASQTLGGNDPDLLYDLLDQLTPERRGRIINDYARVKNTHFPVTLQKIFVKHPETNSSLELTYQRLLMPVLDKSGRNMILNFSKLI